MRRTAFRPHASTPSCELLESSQLERLLDQLVLVFQDVSGDPPSAGGHPFAAGLPRYEFKTKSIFPEAGKTLPADEGTAVRAHAQLRSLLDDAAEQRSPSRTWATAACLRLLEARVGRTVAVRAEQAMRALPPLAGNATPPRGVPAGAWAELREALARLLHAELEASSTPAR
jgi:hypothetical protein